MMNKIKRMCGWRGTGFCARGTSTTRRPPHIHTTRIVQSPQLLGKKAHSLRGGENERDAYTYTTNTGHKNEHRLQKTIGQNSYLCREQTFQK